MEPLKREEKIPEVEVKSKAEAPKNVIKEEPPKKEDLKPEDEKVEAPQVEPLKREEKIPEVEVKSKAEAPKNVIKEEPPKKEDPKKKNAPDGKLAYSNFLRNGNIEDIKNAMKNIHEAKAPRVTDEHEKILTDAVTEYIDSLNQADNSLTKENFRTMYKATCRFGDVVGAVWLDEGAEDEISTLGDIACEHQDFMKEFLPEEVKLIKEEVKKEIADERKTDDPKKIAETYIKNNERSCHLYNEWFAKTTDTQTKNSYRDMAISSAKHGVTGFVILQLIQNEAQKKNEKKPITDLVKSGKMGELADKIIGSAAFDNLGKKISCAKSVDACNRIINDMLTNPKECFTVGANYLQSLKNPEDKMKNKDLTHKLQNGGIVNKPK